METSTRSIATAWLAALWSETYTKTKGALRDTLEDGQQAFCVQGVLGDQLNKADAIGRFDKYDRFWSMGNPPKLTEVKSSLRIPGRAATMAGLRSNVARRDVVKYTSLTDPQGLLGMQFDALSLGDFISQLNDTTEMSFPEIAEILYDVYTGILGVDLPPREEIKALADRGPCGPTSTTVLSGKDYNLFEEALAEEEPGENLQEAIGSHNQMIS